MPKIPHRPYAAAECRRQAEARWQDRQAASPPPPTDADAQRLVHELEVHQIELEMQNAELLQVRSELETALEKFTELYDFAPVGYLTLNREGMIQGANLAAAEMLGVTRSALANRQVDRFITPATRPVFVGFLTRVYTSNTRERCEVALLVEGKAPLEVELEAIASGSGPECRVALTDITDRKRSAEDRLILSKLESTGILAGGIAHDFNNLLTALILNLDMAKLLAPADDEQARYLAQAKATAFLARGLTQQLLAFSKGSALNRKAIRLPGVIQDAARLALSGANVQCDFAIASDLWPVLADEGQIGQVLRNLVLNAREAMPAGGLISVRAENVVQRSSEMPELPAGGFVKVSITDRGTGISREDLPRIFDPYFSTKQRGEQKGMGLGLTICHMVLQKHGGAIAVQTVPGKGTTFDLYLPVATTPAGIDAAAQPRDPRACRKLLVMDDETSVREVFGQTLRSMGHEVELVENGQLAVGAFEMAIHGGSPFDAVFLDLTVRNGMGGWETIEALRQIDPQVKAIVMSGYPDDPIVEEHHRYGFASALVKPFSLEKLREVLAQVLGREPDGKAAP